MAKKKPPEEPGIPEWVVTYGDMMSLLLCFFILLSAFSELKKPREYQKVIESIKEALGIDGGLGMIHTLQNPQNSMINHLTEHAKMAGDVAARSDVNEQSISGRDQTVRTIREGNRWAVGGPIPFAPASSELSRSAKEQLARIAEQIRGQTRKVEIKGHAWGLEDKASGLDYRDLAYQRARAVARYLEKECQVRPELLSIVSAGNSEPKSVDLSDPGAGADNRRVEVVISEVDLAEVHPDPEWQGN